MTSNFQIEFLSHKKSGKIFELDGFSIQTNTSCGLINKFILVYENKIRKKNFVASETKATIREPLK